MLIPIVVVFVLIFEGMTPYRAGLWAIASTFLVHYIRPFNGKRMGWKDFLLTFGEGAKLQLTVGASAGVIGIIIAMLVLPGMPLKIASYAVDLSQGSLFRSEEHTSELQSLMRISYAVFCLKKKKTIQ